MVCSDDILKQCLFIFEQDNEYVGISTFELFQLSLVILKNGIVLWFAIQENIFVFPSWRYRIDYCKFKS